jgi:hypothetical protein
LKPKPKKTKRGRVYPINNEDYDSVTTPLKLITNPPIELWELRLGIQTARRIAKRAANFGTQVHSLCEDIARGGSPKVPKKYQQSRDNFVKWMDEKVDKILLVEEIVVNHRERIAGTLDLMVKLKDGRTAIVDIKTGKVRPTVALQLAAYQHCSATSRTGKCSADLRIALSIRHDRKKPKPIILPPEENERDWQAYLNCLHLWRWYYGKEIK